MARLYALPSKRRQHRGDAQQSRRHRCGASGHPSRFTSAPMRPGIHGLEPPLIGGYGSGKGTARLDGAPALWEGRLWGKHGPARPQDISAKAHVKGRTQKWTSRRTTWTASKVWPRGLTTKRDRGGESLCRSGCRRITSFRCNVGDTVTLICEWVAEIGEEETEHLERAFLSIRWCVLRRVARQC